MKPQSLSLFNLDIKDIPYVRKAMKREYDDGYHELAACMQRSIELAYSDAILHTLQPIHRDCTFENYSIDADPDIASRQRLVIDSLQDYLINSERAINHGVNVIVAGTMGTGKDHLLSALAKDIASHGHYIEHFSGCELSRLVLTEMKRPSDLFDRLMAVDVLYISDPYLVRSDGTAAPLSNYFLQQFSQVVDDRYASRKPIWMSMNASTKKDLENGLNMPMVDRLLSNALKLSCQWPSHRMPFTSWENLPTEVTAKGPIIRPAFRLKSSKRVYSIGLPSRIGRRVEGLPKDN